MNTKLALNIDYLMEKYKWIKYLADTNIVIDLLLKDTDFEDGLQYYSAIETSQDIIITRNFKRLQTNQFANNDCWRIFS